MSKPVENHQASLSPEKGSDFVRLFAEHHSRILAYIYSLIPNFQDAEDICQKTSLVLWSKFHQVEPDGGFLSGPAASPTWRSRSFRRTAARDRLYFSEELMAVLADHRASGLPRAGRRLLALQECTKQLSLGKQELAPSTVLPGTIDPDASRAAWPSRPDSLQPAFPHPTSAV